MPYGLAPSMSLPPIEHRDKETAAALRAIDSAIGRKPRIRSGAKVATQPQV